MVILRDILKSRSTDYYSKFLTIENNSKKIMSNSKIIFSSYTNHDIPHLENVEKNINEIITADSVENLSDEEIFCLLSAAWLHDVGMIPFDNERESFENKSKEERENFRNDIREKHHIRSSLYVEKHKEELNINEFEAKAIGNICRGHRSVDLNNLNDVHSNPLIRVDSLAAIIRLADECDISEARDSCLSSEGINPITKKQHYRRLEIVKTIHINHEKNNISIISTIEKESDKEILINSKNKILQELLIVQQFLEKINICLKDVVLNTTMSPPLLRTRIILGIVKNNNIYEFVDEFMTNDDVDEEIEKLITDKTIENEHLKLSEDFDKFKEIFELFADNNNLEELFFTDYVQNMIPKCFIKLENNFNVDWEFEDRDSRMILLKNSPTALHFSLFMDELIKIPNFNTSSNQNGVLMFDSILLFGLFNDIYHYTNKINFEDIETTIKKFEIFDIDYVFSRINACKELCDD